MKQLKTFSAIIILACLFFSCNGNHSDANVKESSASSTVQSPETTTANSTGDASYSYTIDGKISSGKGNADYLSAFKSGNGIVKFVLANIEPNQQGIPTQFTFIVANEGTTIVHGTDNPNYSVRYSPANTLDFFYQCKEMTVTITSSGESRVTGTFSGTLIEPKTDREVPVSNGRFDMPYSPYSKK